MVVVGLMADPGLPDKVVRSLAEDVTRSLDSGAADGEGWRLDVSAWKLPLSEDGTIPLAEHAGRLKAKHGWDYLLYVTDLPRQHEDQVLVVELIKAEQAAMISLPALGGINVRARLRRTILQALQELAANGPADNGSADNGSADTRDSPPEYRSARGVRGYLPLLVGMVRSNRPWRLVPSLSNSLAAALAAGAFGIFYASIWDMADALTPLRLLGISLAAITAMTVWLVIHNGLWAPSDKIGGRRGAALDNVATIATLFLSTASMYVVLYVLILLGALAVISGDYLQTQLEHPVAFVDYLNLSWLATSLGLLAGALGSNFDGDDAVREATYSLREQERRELQDKYDDGSE